MIISFMAFGIAFWTAMRMAVASRWCGLLLVIKLVLTKIGVPWSDLRMVAAVIPMFLTAEHCGWILSTQALLFPLVFQKLSIARLANN